MRNKYLLICLVLVTIFFLTVDLTAEAKEKINAKLIEKVIQKTNSKLYRLLIKNNGIKIFSEEILEYMEKNKIPMTTLRFVLRVMPQPRLKSQQDIETLSALVSETIRDVDLSLRRGNFYTSARFEVIKRLKSYNKGEYNTEKGKSNRFGETRGLNSAIKKMEKLHRENMKNQIKTRIKENQREHIENEHNFQGEPTHHSN